VFNNEELQIKMNKMRLFHFWGLLLVLSIAFFTSCNKVCNCATDVPVPDTVKIKTTDTVKVTPAKTLTLDTISFDEESRYARVSSVYPTSNYANSFVCLQANYWTVGGSPLVTRCFFTMDLSSLPTDTSQIKSATLIFHSVTDGSNYGNIATTASTYTNGNSFDIIRVTQAWDDSTINWNTAPTFSTLASDLVNFAGNGSLDAVYTADATLLVKRVIASGVNYGFCIKLDNETVLYNGVTLYTGRSLSADQKYAEKLAVTYYK